MATINKIHTVSDNAINDLDEETATCYRPFRKRTVDHSNRHNSVAGRIRQRKTSDLAIGSFVSLSLAMAKKGGIDVYDTAVNGDLEELSRAFKSRFYLDRIDYPDENGLTLMHLAAIHDHGEIVNSLIKHGAAIDSIEIADKTPLHLAARHNACVAIKALVQDGAMLDVVDSNSRMPLHYACEYGCNEAVETILYETDVMKTTKTIINAYDKERATPLHLAVVTCSEDTIHKLLQRGANIYRKDVVGHTPLLFAVKRIRTEIIKIILEFANSQGKHDYVRVPNEFGMTAIHLSVDSGSVESELLTPLHLAALNGYYEIAEILINKGAKVNTPDSKKKTCLHYAALSNNAKLMDLLLSHGALIEAKDINSQTPLMAAACHDCVAALQFLIQNGASTSGQDKDGKTCLHLIAEKDCKETVAIILEHSGLDLINVRDTAGYTPILAAAVTGRIRILGRMMARFQEFIRQHQDCDGNNILHLAALNNHRDTVAIINDHMPFVNVNARNFLGQKPLHLAALNGNNRVIHALIKRGASVDSRDNSGWTPLHYASNYGFETSVELLLSNEAAVDAFNEAKKTPLLLACEKGNTEATKLLLENGADPSIRNDRGQNCLDIACEFRYNDIGLAIIETKYWERVMNNRAFDGYNPMKRLIERLPHVAEAVMDRSITHTKSKYGKEEWEQVAFNFTYLETSPEDTHSQDVKDKYVALKTISSLDRVRLMKHSLVTAYAYQKWKAGHRAMYLGKIFLDFIYLIGLSIPIVMDTLDFISLVRNTNASSNSYSNLTAPGVPIRNIFVFVTVMIMICGFSYILASGRRIILHFLKQTVFELFVAVLGLLYALPFNKPIGYENLRIGALLILCLFINVIFIMRSFSRLGLYISMLITTITTIIRVSVVFILLLVAFAGAFAIILNDEATFRQFDAALVTILTMSAGELNYANTFHHLINTGRLTGFKIELILFAAMVVIINIAFSNLLIGLAVGDINEVRETASLNLAKSQYESIIGINESYPIYLKKILYSPGLIVRKDKNSSYLQKQTWHSLTDNIAMIQEEKDQVNPEFDWRSLNAFVLRQQTEIRLLKESIEDVKSDIKMISYSSHSETNKLIKQVLHTVQANGNEKVTTTSAN